MKNLIFSQTNDKFAENSTWRTFKYPNHEIQNKKLKSLSKIKKLGSFFDFHTKRPKLQNREMLLVAVMHGFGGWNFAGDITMNHIYDFLLIKLDLSPSKHPMWILREIRCRTLTDFEFRYRLYYLLTFPPNSIRNIGRPQSFSIEHGCWR